MTKFKNYIQLRDKFELCAALVEHEVDVDVMCEHIKSVINTVGYMDEADLHLEFMTGLKAGLAGAGGVAGYGVGAGARVGGQALGGMYNKAKAMGGQALNKMGQMGSSALNKAGQFAQNAGNAGMQAYQASKINDAMRKVGDLESFLTKQKMGDPKMIGNHFQGLRQQLGLLGTKNQTMGSRLGQGGMSIGQGYEG